MYWDDVGIKKHSAHPSTRTSSHIRTHLALSLLVTGDAIVVAAATVTATAVGGDDNGGSSDGRGGHRQQSTKIGSEDTVAVAIAIHRGRRRQRRR